MESTRLGQIINYRRVALEVLAIVAFVVVAIFVHIMINRPEPKEYELPGWSLLKSTEFDNSPEDKGECLRMGFEDGSPFTCGFNCDFPRKWANRDGKYICQETVVSSDGENVDPGY